MYAQEIQELIREWFKIVQSISCSYEDTPITLIDYIKLRSQNGTVKFIKDEDWKILKNQRTKLNRVEVKLESINEDFK